MKGLVTGVAPSWRFARKTKWLHSLESHPGFVKERATRRYVFDVTSVGQRSSPWTCKLNASGHKISPRVQVQVASFPSAQLMLRQMHLTKVFESVET